jgi:two-component system, response regulator YesN
MGVDEDQIFNKSFNPFIDVYSQKTLEEMAAWLNKFCKGICDAVAVKRNDFCESIVLKAKDYIYENYNDENLSLNSLCKHLLISTSYFSLIFKNHTGGTFIEYLSKIRIEKAMELLKNTSLKTYEIADRIGYNDPHYFSMAFKKVAGLTPTEYRESVKRENLK